MLRLNHQSGFITRKKGVSPMLNRKRNENIEDIENEIEEWRSQNKKEVEIILFPGEEEYLTNHGYIAIPLLFEIKDKFFMNMKNCPNFIKDFPDRKSKKIFRLKKSDREVLDSHGIQYEPLGYIVNLVKKEQV